MRTTGILSVLGLLLAVVLATPARADAVRQKQWYLSALGITKAWTVSRGANIKVGVLDSGIDGKHVQDLRDAVVSGKNFAGVGAADGQTPLGAHGTEVASVLAGRGHGAGHASGVIGSAPAASLVSIVRPMSNGEYATMAAAIRWGVDQGIKVLNVSLDFIADEPVMKSAIAYAEAHDVVVVAAAGNDPIGHNVDLPGAYPGVIAVSGIDADLEIDHNATTGKGVVLAAPYSTGPTNSDGSAPAGHGLVVAEPLGAPEGQYGNVAGTSFATPIVAGIVALVRAKFPQLDAANVINRLIKSATPMGSGRPNDQYGYGIVNAYRAVTADIAPVTANPLGSLNPTAPASTSPPASSSPPVSNSPASTPPASTPAPSASTPATAATATSSGLGAGAWAGIAAVVVVAAILIGLLVARDRRRRVGPGPGPYTR